MNAVFTNRLSVTEFTNTLMVSGGIIKTLLEVAVAKFTSLAVALAAKDKLDGIVVTPEVSALQEYV
jgi:hypothetical protein